MSQENSSISLNDKLSEKLNELNQLNKEESDQFKINEAEESNETEVKESNEAEDLDEAEESNEAEETIEAEESNEAEETIEVEETIEAEDLDEAEKSNEAEETIEAEESNEAEETIEAEKENEETNEQDGEPNEQTEETNQQADAILNFEINKEIELFYFYDLERKYEIYNKNGEKLISSQAKLSFKNTIVRGKKENCLNFDNKINLKVLINDNKVKGFGFNKKPLLLARYFNSKVTNLDIGKIIIL